MLNYKKTNKSSSKRSAFTLIELSIVLIIIGLLVAGITGGASLIKAAELRAVMAEARDYKIAANAFFTKYDALPGDYDVIIGTVVAGNNDGTINQTVEIGDTANVREGSEALQALFEADMGGLDGADYNNIPKAKIDTAGWIFGSRDIGKNVVFLTGAEGIERVLKRQNNKVNITSKASNPGVSYQQAGSIDRKMDDGVLDKGRVRSTKSVVAGRRGNVTADICETHINGDDYINCSVTFDL